MPVLFQKYLKTTRFLDPNRDYQEGSQVTEIRIDPLTGRTSRILSFPMRVPKKPDLAPLVEASLTGFPCPFCPGAIENATPKFPVELAPEGRLTCGQAIVFPNMFPYDTYSAVGIFSGDHFVALTGFTEELITNAFMAGVTLLQRERPVQGPYGTINWNYMPPAGGSIIHPHIHVLAGDVPTNYQRETIEASQAYLQEKGTIYWDDLVEAERELGDRYIGETGSVQWLASFAPTGYMDVMALFPTVSSASDLTAANLRDLARGLLRVFAYFDSKQFWSFNLALHTGLPGDTSYRAHARLVPRFSFGLNTSDVRYAEILHQEVITSVKPEDLCRELKDMLQ